MLALALSLGQVGETAAESRPYLCIECLVVNVIVTPFSFLEGSRMFQILPFLWFTHRIYNNCSRCVSCLFRAAWEKKERSQKFGLRTGKRL